MPAIVLGIWQGNLTDESVEIDGSGEFAGEKPEPFDKVTIGDVNAGKRIYYSVKGYKAMQVVVGISFFYRDENRQFSFAPDPDDPKFTLYPMKRGTDVVERYQIESDQTGKDIFPVEAGKQKAHFLELPHQYPMDTAPGVHLISFRIAEGKYEKQRKNPSWIWKSEPIEYTVVE